MSDLRLIGFHHSVYTRSVRIALAAKGLEAAYSEVMPFSEDGQAALAGHHPFGRVPVLYHRDVRVYETGAILTYLETAFPEIALTPPGAVAQARMRQVQGIADAYLYWPLVRQAFGQGVYRPLFEGGADPDAAAAGMTEAPRVLDALEEIAAEGQVLTGAGLTQADCHLAPMMEYFAMVPGAAGLIAARPALARWCAAVAAHPAVAATRPDFVTL